MINWYAASSGKLCPTGWYVPTDAERTTLTDYLGGSKVAGGKLKGTGTAYWMGSNKGSTNDYGFTALPGGNRITIRNNNFLPSLGISFGGLLVKHLKFISFK